MVQKWSETKEKHSTNCYDELSFSRKFMEKTNKSEKSVNVFLAVEEERKITKNNNEI